MPLSKESLRESAIEITRDADVVVLLALTNGDVEIVCTSKDDCLEEDYEFGFAVAIALKEIVAKYGLILNVDQVAE